MAPKLTPREKSESEVIHILIKRRFLSVQSKMAPRFSIRTALDSCRKLGGAAQHLIAGSEKRISQLSFEF